MILGKKEGRGGRGGARAGAGLAVERHFPSPIFSN